MTRQQYMYVIDALERQAADARRMAADYAEGEEYRESAYQDGRSDGIQQALRMISTLDPDRGEYLDTRDRIGGWGNAPD